MSPSLLVDLVLKCLAEHPHDSTAERVAGRLGDVGDPAAVRAALSLLEEDALVDHAGGHHVLTATGWKALRRAGSLEP